MQTTSENSIVIAARVTSAAATVLPSVVNTTRRAINYYGDTEITYVIWTVKSYFEHIFCLNYTAGYHSNAKQISVLL